MPEITIQQSTFERLQKHAKPFVDLPDSVVNKALDALEGVASQNATRGGLQVGVAREIDPNSIPSLTHTKVLDATIDGEQIPKPKWNSLVSEIVHRAMGALGDFGRLEQLCLLNMVQGRKEDEGYHYEEDIDVSFQGVDANGACRTIVTVAQALGISVDIGFMWRHKDAAQYPGQRARITIR